MSEWVTFPEGVSTATGATVTGLDNDTEYEFQVAAVNSGGTGTYSTATTATPTAPPVKQGSAAASWSATPAAVGKETPKATATVAYTEVPTAVGKEVAKSPATVTYTQAVTAAGKRTPKAAATTVYAETLTAAGKRAPTGATTTSHSWVCTAAGIQTPAVPKTGSATVYYTRDPVAVGAALTITQAAYRFYDDGTEAGSTALAAQDTTPSVLVSGTTNLQLRMRMQTNLALSTNDEFRLQYERNASGTWENVLPLTADAYSDENQVSSTLSLVTSLAAGQSFTGNGQQLLRASFPMQRSSGIPVESVTAELYEHSGTFGTSSLPTGAPLAVSTSKPGSAFGILNRWEHFDFDGTYTLVNGTKYVIAIVISQASDTVKYVAVAHDTTVPTHPGNRVLKSNAGTWTASATADLIFRVYTTGLTTTACVIPHESANVIDNAATTNRLTAGSGSFVAGRSSLDGMLENFGWTANNYTEVLYTLTLLQANLANSDTLRFRVLRNGIASLVYAQTPTIAVATPAPPNQGTATTSWMMATVLDITEPALTTSTFDGTAGTPLTATTPAWVSDQWFAMLNLDGVGNATVSGTNRRGGATHSLTLPDNCWSEMVLSFPVIPCEAVAYIQIKMPNQYWYYGYNLLLVTYSAISPTIEIVRQDSSVPGTVRNITLQAGVDHTLRIEARGGNFKLFFDGVKTLDWTDPNPLVLPTRVGPYHGIGIDIYPGVTFTWTDLKIRSHSAGAIQFAGAQGRKLTRGTALVAHAWAPAAVGVTPVIPLLQGSATVSHSWGTSAEGIAGPPPFVPDELPGLRFWLEADGLPTGDLAAWPNPGSAVDAAMLGTPLPVVVGGVTPTGKAVVRFKTGEGRVRSSGTGAGEAGLNWTVVYVARLMPGSPAGRVVGATYPPANLLVGYWNGFENVYYVEGFLTPDARRGHTDNWHVYSATGEGVVGDARAWAYEDGVFQSGGHPVTGGWQDTFTISGYDPTTTAETVNADVAGLLFYDHRLTDEERGLAEGYLRSKYLTGVSNKKGDATVTWAADPVALGRRAPLGTTSITYVYALAAVGKEIAKSPATTSWVEACLSAGKRVPKATSTTTYTEALVVVGKRAPKGNKTISNTWVLAAVGAKPVVGMKQGAGTTTYAYSPAPAAGKRAPKGTAISTYAETLTGVGKEPAKGLAGAVSWAAAPVSVGKRTPKAAATVPALQTPAATGKRVPKAPGTTSWTYVQFAQGVKPVPGVKQGSGLGYWVAALGSVAFGSQERMLADTLPATLSAGNYTLGGRFTPTANGRITHIRYYHQGGYPDATHKVQLWDMASQTELASTTHIDTPAFAGWHETALPTPVLVTAGITYVASFMSAGYGYCYTYAPPPSQTPNLTLGDGCYGGPDVFPSTSSGGYTYHVDVVYQTVVAAPQATGKRTPKGGNSLTATWACAAVGKKTQRGTATTSYTETPVSVGKRVPKGSATTTNVRTCAAVGKKTPKATANAISHTWTMTAQGTKPDIPFLKGNGIVTNTWTCSAVGKKVPKGSNTLAHAWVLAATGKKTQKATVTTTFRYNPTAAGKKVPKGTRIVTNTWVLAASGYEMPEARGDTDYWFSQVAVGSKGIQAYWNGQEVVAMYYGDKPVLDWLLTPA